MQSISFPRNSSVLPHLIPVVAYVPAFVVCIVVVAYGTAFMMMQGFFNQSSGALISLGILVLSLGAMTLGGLAATLCCAVVTVLFRGPSALGWVSPIKTTGLSSWFHHSWDYFSNQGQQTGVRVLGLEIAFEGHI